MHLGIIQTSMDSALGFLGFSFILIESERIDGVNAGFDCELAHEAKDAAIASETKSGFSGFCLFLECGSKFFTIHFSLFTLKGVGPEAKPFYAPSNPLGSSAPPSLFTNCLVVTSLDWPSLMAIAFRVTDELTVMASVYSVLLAVGVEPSVV